MTDDNNDPWRSLADELGVQPGQEGSAPLPPSTPNPAAGRQRSQPPHSAPPHSAPPKKSKSDWNALAGELGLEVSADDDSSVSDHDPVAELLGFPPPGSFTPKRDEPEGRRQRDDYDEEHGEESDRSVNRDRWRDEDDQQRRSNMYDDTRPVYDDEPAEPKDRGEGQSSDRGSSDQPREYRPRRRGGRGRGRGRGGDRPREARGGSRYGNENREPRSYDDQRPSGQDEPQGERRYEDEPREGQSVNEARPEGANRDQERSRDEQSQRRRRGRRGRGRGRERSDRRPYEPRQESNRSASDEPIEHLSDDLFDSADVSGADFAVDFSANAEVFGSEHDLHDDHLDHELAPSHASEESEHDDEGGLSDADGNGRSSVRDIITWKEAIGMIIDGNMQSRAESPQNQQHSRPSRGRGRGRGGRGGGRGGHGGGHGGGHRH